MLKLAAVMPDITLPTSSHQRFGASAMRMKSRPKPAQEVRITVRRPKWSESEPCTGEKMNCMSAQAVPKTPYICAARAALPPTKSCTSKGSTGMIMPKASMSMSTVTKMKATAALRRGRAESFI